MTRIRVNVTAELIARATQRDSRHCMIAEALQLAKPEWRHIQVDLATSAGRIRVHESATSR